VCYELELFEIHSRMKFRVLICNVVPKHIQNDKQYTGRIRLSRFREVFNSSSLYLYEDSIDSYDPLSDMRQHLVALYVHIPDFKIMS